MYDILIIGAGVSGCAAARELSRLQASVCVVEAREDVCSGTSKANSGLAHAGFDAREGSLMARLNVEGSRIMESLSEELDFPYRRNGALVLCLSEEDRPGLETLLARGRANGVEGLEILSREQVLAREPHVNPGVTAALWAPSAAIICPFELNLALAENAAENGVVFRFNTRVTGFSPMEGYWQIQTDQGPLEAKCVVNAAGVYAAQLHNLVSQTKLHITPRRGDYHLLDKTAGSYVNSTIFQLPTKYGKGVLVTPTVHGNLLVGPTAIDIDDPEGTNTTREGLEEISRKVESTVTGIPFRETITSFAGLRAHEDGHEFIIQEVEDAPGFFDCAGIESPGLTAAPAIGRMVAGLIRDKLALEEKAHFQPRRKGITDPWALSPQERQALIAREPDYGQIICRCENVTAGQILEAIRRPLGARSLDGIKRRVRPGMGRCQGGFCSPKVMELLARELGIGLEQVNKCGPGSELVTGVTKEADYEGV